MWSMLYKDFKQQDCSTLIEIKIKSFSTFLFKVRYLQKALRHRPFNAVIYHSDWLFQVT